MNFLTKIIQALLKVFSKKSPPPTPTKPSGGGSAAPRPIPTPAQPETPRPTPAEESVSPPASSTTEPSAKLTLDVVEQGGTRVFHITDGVMAGTFREHIDTGKKWKGLYAEGQLGIAEFSEKHTRLMEQLDIPEEILPVLMAISDNEGKFEAVNAYDGAFLSFGFFQWTLGTGNKKGELPALLYRLKKAAPDTFKTYFSDHGIDLHFTSDRELQAGGYLTLDGEVADTPATKDKFRAPEMVYRFWRAGHDPKVQAIQIKHAISRLEQFYFSWKIDGHPLNQLITSQYGVTLILDNHVNLPAHLLGALKTAMAKLGNPDPSNWQTAEEQNFIKEYLQQRTQKQPLNNKHYGPMHNAAGRARTIKSYINSSPPLSDARKSFRYGLTTGRSGADQNLVPAPEGYDPNNYPDLEELMEMYDTE